jgi:hypothetical protein
MKRLFIAFTMLLTTVSMSSFATETTEVKVASIALQSFKSSFTTATDVAWSAGENFYKAEFQLNGQHLAAFYNPEGEMLALTKNIASTQLPVGLQTSLKQDYNGYWISDLFEIATAEGTSYYVTLENADKQVVLKSSNSSWSTFQKQSKS